jgi:Caspase domain
MSNEDVRRALLVGIESYQYLNRLSGCVNDVVSLTPLLQRDAEGDKNFGCRALVSGRDTVHDEALLEGLDELLSPGADVALFYFAGHGMPLPNDVLLATQNTKSANVGVRLSNVLAKIQASPVPEVFIILDCCFSGAAGGVPQLGINVAAVRDGLAILTASRPDQTAAETPNGRGEFSSLLCGALDGGAADVLGKVSIAGIYAYLAESFGSWGQKPTFKANLKTLRTLRKCKPALLPAELRKLVSLFPMADHLFPLNPTYEPTHPSAIPDRVEIMKLLQRGRAARIIEPVGTDHLYYAAIESKPCKLTPLGMHYWRTHQDG